MRVFALILGLMLTLMGGCTVLGNLGEANQQRALGGWVIAFVLFLVGVPLLIAGARGKRADEDEARTKTCPHCAERIMPEAKVCRFCGRDVA